jgi:hypothetical protein
MCDSARLGVWARGAPRENFTPSPQFSVPTAPTTVKSKVFMEGINAGFRNRELGEHPRKIRVISPGERVSCDGAFTSRRRTGLRPPKDYGRSGRTARYGPQACEGLRHFATFYACLRLCIRIMLSHCYHLPLCRTTNPKSTDTALLARPATQLLRTVTEVWSQKTPKNTPLSPRGVKESKQLTP